MNKIKNIFQRYLKHKDFSTDHLKYIDLFKPQQKKVKSNFTEDAKNTITKDVLLHIKKYLFNTNDNPLINLTNTKISLKAGDALLRVEPKKAGEKPLLKTASPKEINEATTIAIGGIGGDDPKQISALLKAVKNLSSTSSTENLCKPIAIFPEVDKEERYEAAKEYTLNPQYVPSYIQERVEKYLLPRLINNLEADVKTMKLSLFSFSMGGREVMMMQTATRNILEQKLLLPKIIVDNLMKDINVVSIGYAANVEAFQEQGFNKIVVFSVNDRGVLIPDSMYKLLMTKKGNLIKNLYIKQMNEHTKSFNYSIVSGKDYFDPMSKKLFDHTISQYVTCINKMPDNIIETIGDCINPDSEL